MIPDTPIDPNIRIPHTCLAGHLTYHGLEDSRDSCTICERLAIAVSSPQIVITTQSTPAPAKESSCAVCSHPLGYDTRSAGYITCLDHRHCTYCRQLLTPTELRAIHYCAIKRDEVILPEMLLHSRCKINIEYGAGSTQTLQLNQETIDLVNIGRLFRPNLDLTENGDGQATEFYGEKWFHELSIEEQLRAVYKAEVFAALGSRLVNSNKESKAIKAKMAEEDKKRFENALKTQKAKTIGGQAQAQRGELVTERPSLSAEEKADEKAIKSVLNLFGGDRSLAIGFLRDHNRLKVVKK